MNEYFCSFQIYYKAPRSHDACENYFVSRLNANTDYCRRFAVESTLNYSVQGYKYREFAVAT